MKINLFGKYSSKVKNISIGFLIVLFVVVSIMNGCNKRKSEELFKKTTKLELENDLLKRQVEETDLEIAKRQKIQDSLMLAYDIKTRELDNLKKNYGKLKVEFEDLKNQVSTVTADESYEFLDKIAYPYTGVKRFQFNEPQVKGIHLTWLENSNLKLQNVNLTDQVNKTELMITNLNEINNQCEDKFKLLMTTRDKYENMFVNSEKARIYTEDELKRIQRQNKVLKWGTVGGAAGGFLLGLLLLK